MVLSVKFKRSADTESLLNNKPVFLVTDGIQSLDVLIITVNGKSFRHSNVLLE